MIHIFNTILFVFSNSITYSQTVHFQKLDNKSHVNYFDTDEIILNYSPRNIIKKIGFLPKNLVTSNQGIEFTFITETKDRLLIKLDGIILKSTNNKIVVINKPISDSVYYLSNGNVSWNVIHSLDKSELDFFIQER